MDSFELKKLDPEAYLNPDFFITDNEKENDKAFIESKFKLGLYHSSSNESVGINYNGSWFSCYRGVYNVFGEIIGKHPGTASILKGLLKGRARFFVFRMKRGVSKITTIKEIGEILIDNMESVSEFDQYNSIKIYRGIYKNIFHYFFFKDGRKRIFASVEFAKQMIRYIEVKNDI